MWAETTRARHHGAAACALFAALVVGVLGGGAGTVMIASFEHRMAASAHQDMALVGTSLAHSLAQRYARAARYGIPLHALPGIDAHLAEALAQTRGIARIALVDNRGETLGLAGDDSGDDTVTAPVEIGDDTLATIAVTVRPTDLVGGAGAVRLQIALAVALAALAAAIGAAIWPGREIDRQRRQLGAALAAAAANRPAPATGQAPRDAIGAAFVALHNGAQRLDTHQHELDAYAVELLAVDFDDQLRPAIEQVQAHAAAPAVIGGPS